jgi:nicotinate-nucleotide pyrophosphorylase (carboxylating)
MPDMSSALNIPVLPPILIDAAIREALAEDLGLAGDITTNATVAADAKAEAVIATRRDGVVSGLQLAEAAFRALAPSITFEIHKPDGSAVKPGTTIASISGNARAILTAERVALNFMGRMSGIATLTRKYCDAISGTHAKVADTRKTTPGLRAFEKYAVRCGGGQNHRSGLFDAILIKDNHIVAAGGIEAAIKAAHIAAGHMLKIEIEVDTLEQLDDVLKHKIDVVLLDNMTPAQLKDAVKRVAGRCLTEASGGVNLDTVRAIADTGVDMISVGALTHSAPVLDLGLDFKPHVKATKRTLSA